MKKVGFSTMACAAKISWHFCHLNIVGYLLKKRFRKVVGAQAPQELFRKSRRLEGKLKMNLSLINFLGETR